jgi:hypothetical protein
MTCSKISKYISFSGGIESTTMCILFNNDANAIFADTGWEHDVLYKHIETLEKFITENLNENFKIIRVKGNQYAKGKQHDNLVDYIKTTKYFPSPISRFCTKYFKIFPIDNFLKKQKCKCELLIGLNSDEKDRIGNHEKIKSVTYKYPLISLNINREKCISILKHADMMPDFPPYMSRGGCIGCFFKSKNEYRALALLNPKEAYSVAELERSVQDKRGKYYSLRNGIPDMKKFIDQCIHENLFPPQELYSNYDSINTPCGIFCHR